MRGWWLPAGIAALCLLLETSGDAGRLALRFDRNGIEHGEFWRLLTGHLVHLGWAHFALNLAGMLLVWLLVGTEFSTRSWAVVLLVSIAGIDAGLWFLDPGIQWYVGLSGLLHGILMAGIVAAVRRGSREAAILGLLVAAKIVWEHFVGPLPGSEGLAGAAVVVNAHLYGAVVGGLAGEAVIRARRRRSI
jgi:rhomboid family GlyGly-CTERM serine protease